MGIFSKIIHKILKENSLDTIRKSKNSKIGGTFKLGNFATISTFPSSSFVIENGVDIRNYCSFYVGENATLILQNRVFMNNYCSINALEKIEIGENTLFGEGVRIYDHNHEYTGEKVETRKFKTAPVKIGKDCWLGSNVVVLKGVTIGDNCIIGAGCLVYKDVPAGSVVKQNQPFS